jgi:hypothetical protein
MTTLPYIYRWDRVGRKGEPCAVEARARPGQGENAPRLAFGTPARPRFNSILVRFADGFAMVTSGNAIRRRPPP